MPEVTTVKRFTPKQGAFDITKRVKVKATTSHPFRKEGEEMNISPVLAEHFKLNGWAK
jgi:hypothetical protein